jgi:mycothiol synthase
VTLRRPGAGEADAVQAVWERSHGLDDPGGRPRGGWSVDPWATDVTVLVDADRVIGVAAIRAESSPAEAVAARVALDPEARTDENATALVQACIDMACHAHGEIIRLSIAERALWAIEAAKGMSFHKVRSIYHMLLAHDAPVDDPRMPRELRVRLMRPGEEQRVLEALNRNWAGTWDFVPIRPEMLESDLEGQRDGMLLVVEGADDDRIVATCHAVFDRTEQNPDGDPKAWISNLTVDPDYRGRGVARALLLAGLLSLRARGAGSITLGVDAGDPAPLKLYLSVGFETVSSVEVWDKPLMARA